ncbi:hypothetical protein EV424DRAFT_1352112 [Suillus variegatus]|nr:hypothetical protein EV424DRAFT_1352112 [Suillus variegatus]
MARSASPAIMPQQTKLPLIKAEIAVLQAHLEDWRSVKGKDRHLVLKAVHKEACLQAPTRDKALLKARKKKWTAHRVLIEQNKACIREETGEMPGKATKTVLAGLSAEEKEEANVLADKWNNEAAPAELQANVAETKGADIIEHFATEMFKQAGMRVFVMSAWRDSRGKLMLGAKLLDLEEDNDGLPMLPDTMGLKRGEQQHVIRSFLTRHYSGGTIKDRQSQCYCSVEFWYDRQKKKLCPTFCFKAWRDTDSDMEPAAKSYQKVIHQASHRRNKAHDVPSEESLDEREDRQSSFDNGEEASMSNNAREQTPPGSVCACQNL